MNLEQILNRKDVPDEVKEYCAKEVERINRKIKILEYNELKYRTYFEKANDAIFTMKDNVFIECNPKALDIFGATREQLVGNTPDLFSPKHQPDGRRSNEKAMEKIMNAFSGIPQFFEWKHCKYDGTTFDAEVSLNRIELEDEYHLLAIVRDIAEKKRKDKLLLEQKETIARIQKMEAIGLLAGGVAHDLNNILSGIISYPELLLLKFEKNSALKKPLETIKKSGEKAAAIVQDLLTLARRGVITKEIVNLNAIIDEYFNSPEFNQLKENYKHIDVKTDLADDLLNISGSAVHLSKTIMNLLTNAFEATPEEGYIEISTYNIYLDKVLSGYDQITEGDYVVLKVYDTGIGISEKDLKQIFEPFYTKKVMGISGTGLGMAVVWGTVKDLKGYIDIKSKIGKGTTFELYFPISRKKLTQEKNNLPITEYSGSKETILIVDDIDIQREVASGMLKLLNYNVKTVDSGEKAIKFVKNNKVDLIVLDMIMDPGINGLETYKKILKINPDQKAIIASGFTNNKNVKEAQGLGAGSYIKKPYTLQKLGLAVQKELSRKK